MAVEPYNARFDGSHQENSIDKTPVAKPASEFLPICESLIDYDDEVAGYGQ